MRLTLAFIVLVGSLTGQVEHAPTVAQCQADQRLWLSQVEQSPTDPRSPHYLTLIDWNAEMNVCEKVDPENVRKYNNTETEIAYLRLTRFRNFLQRHQLLGKFLEEDTAGKR